MRRKPVVVVGVAAVLLGVGVLAAGQAGAEETPQWPDVPGFSLADLPGFSAWGGDSDAGSDDSAAQSDAARPDAGDPDRDADNSSVAGGSDVDDSSGVRDGSGAQDAQRPTADQTGSRPAGHAVPKEPVAQKPGVTTAQRPAPQLPAAPRPAARPLAAPQAAVPVRQKPALAQQDAGGSLVAAAKRNVTAADVSSSPNAPVQQQILALINQNRRQHGCGGVTLDRRLIDAANSHAADMARHDYFAHESRDGEGAGDRVTQAGYNWRHYGENIARGVDSSYAVVDGWMHSPEHRHNILDCSLDQMGIGLAIAGDRERTIYWVQDFATPM